MTKTEERIDRIARTALFWLRGERSYLSSAVRCGDRNLSAPLYSLVASRLDERTLLLQELLLSTDGTHHVHRSWTLRRERKWEAVSLEKGGAPVFLKDLPDEAEDLDRRLDVLLQGSAPGALYFAEEVAAAHRTMGDLKIASSERLPARLLRWFNRTVFRPTVFYPVLAGAALLLSLFSGGYYARISEVKRTVDEQVHSLDSFLVEAEDDLVMLKRQIERDKDTFEFNRRNAYISVRRLQEELPAWLPARRESYALIAANIEEAVSYGEIIYEMSRLPSEEYQARIFLATDPQKTIPLSRFRSAFPSLGYPVQIPNQGIDGRGFRITDGYMDRREHPLGTGGTMPHFAVDIINVGNISAVNYSGEIIREGFHPGFVVAAREGVVKAIGQDDGYGWNIEVQHPLEQEVLDSFPDAVAFSTYYAHLADRPVLEPGMEVSAGQPLGVIGETGRTTGPHLHFEVRVYHLRGRYWDSKLGSFDKVNPFPEQKATEGSVPLMVPERAVAGTLGPAR